MSDKREAHERHNEKQKLDILNAFQFQYPVHPVLLFCAYDFRKSKIQAKDKNVANKTPEDVP